MVRIAILSLACTVSIVGCERTPLAPRLLGVQIVDLTPADAAFDNIDIPALETRAKEILSRSGGFLVGERMAKPRVFEYRLRVEIRREEIQGHDAKETLLRAYVVAHLMPVGAPIGTQSFDEAAAAERKVDRAHERDRALWREHLLRAVGDVLATLGGRVRLWNGPITAILSALSGKDEELREEAILITGERHVSAAVPSLLALIKGADSAVRDRAIGALAAIGDRRAVRPLTELAHFRDLDELPKVLDALSAIGGDEARAYLELVASGHESAEVRELAKRALSHLDSKLHHRADPTENTGGN
jgi:hypothetical protein